MIYRNDNIEITDEYVKGSVEDIMEYFRYEIAHQSMTGTDCDYENYLDNVDDILDVISDLWEDLENEIFTKNDIVKVSEHSMGGFIIERGGE